ncbi:MAG: dienelactone hydrolase family protein [Planctomycetota bacterium]|nr:dienelactone hydrolase family protein [Planctomycetota bacterium]
MRGVLMLIGLGGLCVMARAEIATQAVEYRDGETALEGYLAWDDAGPAKRPGVIVAPDWMGPSEFYQQKAQALAKLGYVAFVADIYGKGIRPKERAEAGAQAGKYKKDRPLMRGRMRAALAKLLEREHVDPQRVAAIGFCFGGTCVLELARGGAEVAGVASFHGGLDSPTPEDAKNIKGKVLVLHGADDPNVPPEQVAAFQQEMREAKVDWHMVSYGGAVHSFTKPAAGNDPSKGAAYDEKADKRSWQTMRDFFGELFGK